MLSVVESFGSFDVLVYNFEDLGVVVQCFGRVSIQEKIQIWVKVLYLNQTGEHGQTLVSVSRAVE
jgi:hypothetical protein